MGEVGFQLRAYQQAAVDATWDYLRSHAGAPVIILPTGSGKTPVIVSMARQAVEQWQGRVLIVSHVRELLTQIHATMLRLWPEAPVGINSAGLGSRETDTPILIAGIQSIFRDPSALGKRDLVFIDECDLISPEDGTMYQTLLATMKIVNPALRFIGCTASPFRLDSGYIYGPGQIFEGVSYEANVRELIDQGYLCMLRGKDGGTPDLSGVHIRGGEYIPAELDAAVNTLPHVKAACKEIVARGEDRKGWLCFCCSVEHAFMVNDQLKGMGVTTAIVIGDTPSAERTETIRAFKAQELRCLVSVGVLGVGFDAPHCDLIALLRPTLSARLYLQQVGRGLRICEGKKDALILDFSGNIERHGSIDALRITNDGKRDTEPGQAPVKTCPACREILPLSAIVCNGCGREFPREPAKHDHKAAEAQPLAIMSEEWVDVVTVDWFAYLKKGAPDGAPKTLRMVYMYGLHQSISEYICIEHSGYARKKAESWWLQTTGNNNCPSNAQAACAKLDDIGPEHLRLPMKLHIRFGGQWPEIIGRENRIPTLREPGANEEEGIYQPESAGHSDDEPPF